MKAQLALPTGIKKLTNIAVVRAGVSFASPPLSSTFAVSVTVSR
jgi:hypothetical protein